MNKTRSLLAWSMIKQKRKGLWCLVGGEVKRRNRLFPSSHQLPFQSEAKCYENQFSFILKFGTNYHNKNFAVRLALKERLRGTRKWPIWYQTRRSKIVSGPQPGCCHTCTAKGVDHERCPVVLKTGCILGGKMCLSRRKMKTVIVLEEKHVFHHKKHCLSRKRPLLNRTLGLRDVSAELPITRDGCLRRNTW